ncbi:MAG: molecular chaperone HscC [Lysobacterales bacterium]
MTLGIDLGTTHSLAAIWRDGATQLVPNALGEVLTPSAVSVDEQDRVLVGRAARERLSTHPARTAVAFKRWMGTDRSVRLGNRSFRPEELSALVLRSLKEDAEAWLGAPVSEAVITVPAYFNQAQRRATKAAAELAGLRVERLLNEPTAAGLAYGLQESPDHTTFLVFDLGGGTFDVSVLEYFEGVVQVRASAGDTRLGGEDYTEALGGAILARLGELGAGARERLRSAGVLWRAAEQAKRELSERASTRITLVHEGQSLDCELGREDFEQACAPLMQRLRRPIERALLDARLQPSELAEVVLVGGATRMPMIRQAVTRLFQRLPLRTIHPDETIARGAAIQAALLARAAALDEVVLTDVMPYSLGVVVQGDRYSPIIERNMPVPVSRSGHYVTVQDQQSVLLLDIRQGESPVGSENLALGVLEVPVPPKKAGEAGVEVRFSYDANGLLVVDAHDAETGRRAQTVIRQRDDQLSDAQLADALARLDQLKVHPRDQQENRFLVERAKRLYEDRLGVERERLQQALLEFQAALETQDLDVVARARTRMRELLDSVDRAPWF